MTAIPESLRLPVVIGICIIFLACLFLPFYRPRKNWQAYKALKALANFFPGSRVTYWLVSARLSGQFEGNKFIVWYSISTGTRNNTFIPSYNFDHTLSVALKLEREAQLKIVIYKFGNIVSSISRKAVILKEVNNVPPALAELTFYSSSPMGATRFLSDEQSSSALQYFSNNGWIKGFETMTIGNHSIKICKTIQETDLTGAFVKTLLDKMIMLKIVEHIGKT